MSREFNLTPKRVSRVETPFRRIVTDLPVGADLEYADEVTLTRALEGRRELG